MYLSDEPTGLMGNDYVLWLEEWRQIARDLFESNALGYPEDIRRWVGADVESYVRDTLDELRREFPDWELPRPGTLAEEVVVETLVEELRALMD